MLSTPESVGSLRNVRTVVTWCVCMRSGDSRIGAGQALRANLLWGELQTRQKGDGRSTGGGLHA